MTTKTADQKLHTEVIRFDWEHGERRVYGSSYVGKVLSLHRDGSIEELEFTLTSNDIRDTGIYRIWRMQYGDFAIEWKGSADIDLAKMGAMNFFTQVLMRKE